eukprot:c21826_g1_i1 orf=1-777(-)
MVQCFWKFSLQTRSAFSVSSRVFSVPGKRKNTARRSLGSSIGHELSGGIGGMKWIHLLAGGHRVYSEGQRGIWEKQTMQKKRDGWTSEFEKFSSRSSDECVAEDNETEVSLDIPYFTNHGGLRNQVQSYSRGEKFPVGGSRTAVLASGDLGRENRYYHSVINDSDDDFEDESDFDDDFEEESESDDDEEDALTSKRKPALKRGESSSARKRQRPATYENTEDTDSRTSHLTQTRFDEFKISPLSIKSLHTLFKYERMTA